MADNNNIIKTQAVASDLEVKEVTSLEKVERMHDDDVLLLIRQMEDGSQKCFKVRGYDFHGEDAYVIAKNHGFEGTYEDWQAAVNKVVDVQPLADNLTEVTKKAEKATADAISETEAVKLIAEQVSAAEAIRVAAEAERQSNEEARAEAETERESNEEARATQEGVRQDNEQAREVAETNRVTAETKREADFTAAKANAEKATSDANSMASHPPYVDADGYYYKWNVGTQTYDKTDVNLVGKPFAIKKVFPSVADMEATDVNTFAENDFLLINTADVEDADNAKLYVVALNEQGEKFYSYLVDLSGFRGFTGKTPQLTIGTITTLEDGEEAAASLTYDGVDNDGNPKYKINFGIPKGKSFTFSDFTEEQLEELKKPATDAANEAKAQVALCEAATAAANEAADASNAQTSLCEAATNSAQDVLTRFGELVAAINIEVVGDGNAIASVSQTDSKLTFTKGSFLPLSGGTLTGDHEFLLEINSSNSYDSNYIRFVKNSTGKATATVGYYRNMAFIANESNSAPRIGVTDDGTPQYWTNFRGDTKYNLIHSGNIYGYFDTTLMRRGITDVNGSDGYWDQPAIRQYNGALPESLSNIYNYGALISFAGPDSRFEMYVNHNSTAGGDIAVRSGWGNDKKAWRLLAFKDNLSSYLPLSGGTLSGDIILNRLYFNQINVRHNYGECGIYGGAADYGASGDTIANLKIGSWYGVSFTCTCAGQTFTGKTAVGIDCRSGNLYVGNNIHARGDIYSGSNKVLHEGNYYNHVIVTSSSYNGNFGNTECKVIHVVAFTGQSTDVAININFQAAKGGKSGVLVYVHNASARTITVTGPIYVYAGSWNGTTIQSDPIQVQKCSIYLLNQGSIFRIAYNS